MIMVRDEAGRIVFLSVSNVLIKEDARWADFFPELEGIAVAGDGSLLDDACKSCITRVSMNSMQTPEATVEVIHHLNTLRILDDPIIATPPSLPGVELTAAHFADDGPFANMVVAVVPITA